MSPAATATLIAAHQAQALAEIVRLCDAALARRDVSLDPLLDIRQRATTELNTVAEEAHPWTRP